MASAPSRRRKAPITAHPAFPGIVALWFAVLLGAGSLVVPVALWERIVTMLGVDGLVAAAAPPLGIKARAIIALAFAVLGALAGLAIARRMAPARSRVAEDAVEDEHASETLGAFIAEDLSAARATPVKEEEDILLFSGFDDDDAADDPLPEFEKPGEPPVFVVPEELAADPIASEEPDEIAAEEACVPEVEAHTDTAPEPVRFVQDLPTQPEPAQSLRAPEEFEDESLADLAARLQDALRRRRAAQPVVQSDLQTAEDLAQHVESAPRVAFDPEPVEAGQADDWLDDSDELQGENTQSETPVAEAEEQLEDDWLDDWSDAPREDAFDETSVPPVPEPDYDLVVAKGRAQLPQAFLEADFPVENDEFAEDAAFDDSLSLPIARTDGPRVTFATLADDLLDDPPIEAGEEDEEYDEDEGSSYGSLLGMKGPYSSGAARDEEDEEDLSAYPQPVFDDEEPEDMEAGETEEAYAAPVQDLGEPEPAAAPARGPLSREEQDAALRDALLGLQRFSGAA